MNFQLTLISLNLKAMVKTKLIPNSRTVSFEVPQSYVGKELEILAYSSSDLIDENNNEEPNGKKLLKYIGNISPERADEMQAYLKQARSEWDRDIY
jgi:hypothetical protein